LPQLHPRVLIDRHQDSMCEPEGSKHSKVDNAQARVFFLTVS
jgi:hypothetical protein